MMFEGKMVDREGCFYGSIVSGNVLEGETDPEYAGKVSLRC